MRVLVLGATGMLGSAIYSYFRKKSSRLIYGTIRNDYQRDLFPSEFQDGLFTISKQNFFYECEKAIMSTSPDVVINCIGLIKQLNLEKFQEETININSCFPHFLANICQLQKIRLIHFSTDCVFSGSKGNYKESDSLDAKDFYAITKKLGEISYPNCLTLRTSIIGHELRGKKSLLEWFLSSKNKVDGYENAFFSGLPTTEIASFLDNYILNNNAISGVYNFSSSKISKYDLLNIIKRVYNLNTLINKESKYKIDRSLDSNKLKEVTGYRSKNWEAMITEMKEFHESAQK